MRGSEVTTVSDTMIRPLHALSTDDRKQFGGKAISLARLIAEGVSVPRGFGISVVCFQEALQAARLDDEVSRLLSGLNEETRSLSTVSKTLMSLVHSMPIGDELVERLHTAFDDLGAEFTAVRSSAPEEDGEKHSWAGQFETVLGVTRDSLIDSIRICWASLFSVRALSYRRDRSDENLQPEIALVVQELVSAEISGVAFSVDPVSGQRDRMIIECVRGLGEGLVSGELSPSRYVVSKENQEVLEKSEVLQEREVVAERSGESKWRATQSEAPVVLSEPLLLELVHGLLRLEAAFGYPLDVEWCVFEDRFYFLQARPVTGLEENELYQRILSETGRFEFQWGERHPIITCEPWISAYPRFRHLPANECTRAFSFADAGFITTYFYMPGLDAAREQGKYICDPVRFRTYLDISQAAREEFRSTREDCSRLELSTATNQELLGLFTRQQSAFEKIYALYRVSQHEYTEYAAERLKALLAPHFPDPEQLEAAFIAATSVTELDIVKEEDMAIYRLSLQAELPQAAIRQHQQDFPWLFFNTYDLKLADTFIIDRVESTRKIPEQERLSHLSNLHEELISARRRQQEVFGEAADSEVEHLGRMFSELAIDRYRLKAVWGGATFRFLDLFQEVAARASMEVEDFLNSYRGQDIVALLETGQRLSENTLRKRQDAYLYYLEGDECRWFEGDEARMLHARLSPKPTAEVLSKTNSLSGIVANTGHAVGIARIIKVEGIKQLLEEITRFKDGEILVTTMTQPTMLTIARKAAAIVTNEGGITSHASVLAREMKIPCIIGTKTATDFFQDGERIEVDAFTGVVRRVSD